MVDSGLVRRSVEDLLANAIKYSPRHGLVSVSVRPRDQAVEVSVADQGPGVPDALKGMLFQTFGSLEAGAGRARRGHGLGLHLVKLVATAHDVARDREAGGTTVVLRLGA